VSPTGARGGRQRIPRPPNVVRGGPSPWAGLSPADRTLTVAQVRERVADLPPARPVTSHPFREGEALDPGTRDAAVLLPLFEEAGEARIVLTKRPDHLPTHQGEIAFPGGKIDAALDATAADAALREAEEEIALPRASVEVVAELDHLPSVGGPFVIAPFVGIVAARPALVPAPGEVERVFDVALSELLADGVHREERWDMFGATRRMHFFDLEDETVWGATARILAGFLAHLTGVELLP
jgi:8-oxo-dGTP pyrophosphatase MutT (NUDIX family)